MPESESRQIRDSRVRGICVSPVVTDNHHRQDRTSLLDAEARVGHHPRMYRIFGQQRGKQPVIMATPRNAREALTHFRAAQNLFPTVTIEDPDGKTIDGFELGRRATAEANRTYE